MRYDTDTEYARLLDRLVVVFSQVERRLAEAARRLEHGDAQSTVLAPSDLTVEGLDAIDKAAIALLQTDHADRMTTSIVPLLRITMTLRRVAGLAQELWTAIGGQRDGAAPEELVDDIHRMTTLTLVQLSAAREALAARDSALAKSTIEREAGLDGWYDLLLGEALEDVAEGGKIPLHLPTTLAVARVLERIGGHALDLCEDAALVATPAR